MKPLASSYSIQVLMNSVSLGLSEKGKIRPLGAVVPGSSSIAQSLNDVGEVE